jgi:dihydropteroate synthase
MTCVADLAGIAVGPGSPVRLMAVLNVSPESFYSGSVRLGASSLRDAARRAADEGADFLDVGAMSTAPYLRTRISADEEVRRMGRAVEVVASATAVPVSADTSRAAVASAALAAGARIVNDVTGLRGDPAMGEVAARAEGLILMAFPDDGADTDAVPLVRRLLAAAVERASQAGVEARHIVLDPGIGFFTRGSACAFNCAVLARLSALRELHRPLLVGVSRKAFLSSLTGRRGPEERLAASLAATAIAVYNGAAVIRAHDVAATRDAIRVAEAIRTAAAAEEATPPPR